MKRVIRWAPALVLAGAALGCRAPEGGRQVDLGLAPSLLPNLGLAASTSAAIARSPSYEWRAEARFTDQFVDDKTFADNGLPEAGNWTQLELGLRGLSTPEERSHWIVRFGAIGFDALGEPNLIEEPGDYLGVYGSFGRETDFGHGFSIGPEISLVAASGPDPFVLFPQLTWGIRWRPGAQ